MSHRAGEIIANVREQLKYAGYKANDLTGGIIVVGGGTRLAGFNERLSSRLGMKLRTGSVNVSEVRITNSKISATEMVDVLSVLCAAVKNNPVDCLMEPAVEEPQVIITQQEVEAEKKEELVQEEEVQKPKRRSSFLDKFKSLAEKLMTDSDNDDDDVYRDDD